MTATFHRVPTASTEVVPRFVPEAPRHFSLQRVDQPGAAMVVQTGRCQLGSQDGNELRIDEPTVSRFHCEVKVDKGVVSVRDLGSSNGTFVDGLQVKEAFLRDGCLLRLGPKATVTFRLLEERAELPLSAKTELGTLLGTSVAMRSCFAQLEHAAATSRAVLLEGETGTGKTAAAFVIHALAGRVEQPVIELDCSAMAEDDLENALFGRHEPRRISAFEEAREGTVLLEEVGELSPRLQGRLLPVLEKNELLRPGSTAVVSVKARFIATTRRDLRTAVNDGTFKSELFYRLAVMRVSLPPLRERLDDVPMLVDQHLEATAVTEDEAARLRTPEFLQRLQSAVWAGNVRELHNHLDRSIAMQSALLPQQAPKRPTSVDVDASKPYAEARRIALEQFEEAYIVGVLRLHGGNVSEAARQAGIDRAYLHRLIKRHNL